MSLLHLNLYFIFLVTWFRVKVLHYTAQVYIEILGILPYHPRCNMPDSIGTFFLKLHNQGLILSSWTYQAYTHSVHASVRQYILMHTISVVEFI